MYPQRLVSQALRLGLLVTLVVLALSACGGDEKEAKARHLPEELQKALHPGEYRSEEFKSSLLQDRQGLGNLYAGSPGWLAHLARSDGGIWLREHPRSLQAYQDGCPERGGGP